MGDSKVEFYVELVRQLGLSPNPRNMVLPPQFAGIPLDDESLQAARRDFRDYAKAKLAQP